MGGSGAYNIHGTLAVDKFIQNMKEQSRLI
jgi:hypothetical protein